MNSTEDALRQRVIDLRLAGRSRAQIQSELGLGHSKLDRWLRGVPPPQWTRRPRAKDDVRDQARALRAEGHTLVDIARQLDVAKSSVSVWVRDLPHPPEGAARSRAALLNRSQSLAAHAAIRRQRTKAQALSDVGPMTDRDLFLIGVALYWAEGGKDKPWKRRERAVLINSDANLIRLYLRWLELVGVSRDDLVCRLSIHESADVTAAEDYWSDVVGIPSDRFRKASLKRHNPRTIRHNPGRDYRGCLVIEVRRSCGLYRQIEGWWHGTLLGVLGPEVLPEAYARPVQSPVGLSAGPAIL